MSLEAKVKGLKQYISEETVKEGVEYHVQRNIPLAECVFRPHSEGFYKFFVEARKQFNEGKLKVTDPFDIDLLNTDIGEMGLHEGEVVPLDIPMMEAEEKVELNKPKRGGPKKFYVYVKDGDKVKKVTFGDTSGLDVNFDDKEARKSFAARHQCAMKKDRTTPGYWSCNLPRYAKQLGLKNGGNFFW
jgi:hypothetical protein